MQFHSEKLKQLDFVKIIKESFLLAWQKKYLWWFGLFVSLGSFSTFSPSYQSEKNSENNIAMDKFSSFFSNHAEIIMIGISIIIILFFILFILSILFRGALIKATNLELENKKSTFKDGFKFGKKYFGKLFTLSLFSFLFLLIIAFIMAIPILFLFSSKVFVFGGILLFIAILIFIPLIILVYFLSHLGYLYIVLGDLKIFPAIENAYALLQKNLSSSLVMMCVFLVTGIIFSTALLIIFIVLFIVLFLFGLLLFFILKTIGAIIAVALSVLIIIPLFFTLRAFYEVFYQTAWIKFFHAIAKPKAPEKVREKIPISKPIPTTDAIEGI